MKINSIPKQDSFGPRYLLTLTQEDGETTIYEDNVWIGKGKTLLEAAKKAVDNAWAGNQQHATWLIVVSLGSRP